MKVRELQSSELTNIETLPRTDDARVRLRINVRGTVQGVGFRPFASRLARRFGLGGWVANTSDGALLEIEGPASRVSAFVRHLPSDAPASARVGAVMTQTVPAEGQDIFSIHPSDEKGRKRLVVSPDLATCADCRREMQDRADRRFRYPFLTCTQCGPRYSVMTGLPYDRPRTSMSEFSLCAACRDEYGDQADRRYHAESIACPDCGPQVALWDERGLTLAVKEEALRHACSVLREGKILAVKGLGGFQLWVDARSEAAVQRLRDKKQRPHKPFAVLFPSLEAVRSACRVSAEEETLLVSPQAPIVILRRLPHAPLAAAVAPADPTVGAMLSPTPLHLLLMEDLDSPVVATSGNRSEEPIAFEDQDALVRLNGIADAFLVHDRPITRAVDDSLVRVMENETLILRRARGYVPLPVPIHEEARHGRSLAPVLGVGGQMKNTVGIGLGDQVMLSQHIGDLSTPEAFRAFRRAIDDLERLLDCKRERVACDLHPDYRSTLFAVELARSLEVPLVRVQHHHAHVAACMAEHGLAGEVLGLAWDGSGYGTDHTLWGGEFLLAGFGGFRRLGHLLPFRLPGGVQAIREPRRTALSLLWEAFGQEGLERGWPPLQSLGGDLQPVAALLQTTGAAPLTTSMGRLFDGVASMMGLCQVASFEGQAGMAVQLEAEAFEDRADEQTSEGEIPYVIPLLHPPTAGAPLVADWRPLVRALVRGLSEGTAPTLLAYRFHLALADLAVRVAAAAGSPHVILTGGCFQNVLLARLARRRLERAGFIVSTHRLVPPNDGGLALGQIMVAAHQHVRGKV